MTRDFETAGQRAARECREAVEVYIQTTVAETPQADLLLHTIVADGRQTHRDEFTRAFRAHFHHDVNRCTYVADTVYRLFAWVVKQRFTEEIRRGQTAQQLAGRALESVVIEDPVTEADIIRSLEVDSSSSDDGRRLVYGRDMWPEKALEIMKDDALRKVGETSVPPDVVTPPKDAA